MSEPVTPLKVDVLKVIYKNIFSVFYRLRSLMESCLSGDVLLSQVDFSSLLDCLSTAANLKIIFEEYIESAEESGEDVIGVSEREFSEILEMAKIIEVSQKIKFMHSGIWTN